MQSPLAERHHLPDRDKRSDRPSEILSQRYMGASGPPSGETLRLIGRYMLWRLETGQSVPEQVAEMLGHGTPAKIAT